MDDHARHAEEALEQLAHAGWSAGSEPVSEGDLPHHPRPGRCRPLLEGSYGLAVIRDCNWLGHVALFFFEVDLRRATDIRLFVVGGGSL
jgi:hypothetical protein